MTAESWTFQSESSWDRSQWQQLNRCFDVMAAVIMNVLCETFLTTTAYVQGAANPHGSTRQRKNREPPFFALVI